MSKSEKPPQQPSEGPDEPYVGYGKPPKHTQFKKGCSSKPQFIKGKKFPEK